MLPASGTLLKLRSREAPIQSRMRTWSELLTEASRVEPREQVTLDRQRLAGGKAGNGLT